mmetsp:Transcript_36509/g.79485  ORF Transcript_36509/g.79485 Transcript_36509/m.79485 type:complete len:355 (+) Transcript_36509:58-1122(+)
MPEPSSSTTSKVPVGNSAPSLPAQENDSTSDNKDSAAMTAGAADENSEASRGTDNKKRSRSNTNDGPSDDEHDDADDSSHAADKVHRGKRDKQPKTRAAKAAKPPGPLISGGVIDLPLGPVSQRLTCAICNGYYREPYTIAECLHTFCKRCLFFAFNNGDRHCPTCDTNLNPDPYRECLADRTLESIVDKLFPMLKEADAEAEKKFYERRGIKMKKEFADVEQRDGGGGGGGMTTRSSPKTSRAAAASSPSSLYHDEMDFCLVPDSSVDAAHRMPPLEMSSLRASGHLKVATMKKFLIMKLKLQQITPSSIEICCNGGQVGDELSLTFIQRTRWIQTGEEVTLTYRYGEEGMFG